MNNDQIAWAKAHDWYITEANEYGERGVWCSDRRYNRELGESTEYFVFISNFRKLREFAGY